MSAVTGQYSVKPYACNTCGAVRQVGTNHWGEIYSGCSICRGIALTCQEKPPAGVGLPPEWEFKSLKSILEVK